MCAVEVDCEKLAESIEDGLDSFHASNFRKLYLRLPGFCGYISTAIDLHLKERGIPSETALSKPNLPFHQSMEHVVTLVNDKPENPLLIDATYGQFLRYTGYDIAYDNLLGRDIYPRERVVAFRFDERAEAVRDIAKAALKFRGIEQDLIMELGFRPGEDWIPEITTEQQMTEVLDPIWNSDNFNSHVLSGEAKSKAAILSKYISKNAFKIE